MMKIFTTETPATNCLTGLHLSGSVMHEEENSCAHLYLREKIGNPGLFTYRKRELTFYLIWIERITQESSLSMVSYHYRFMRVVKIAY
jgi:hypothetical protein